MEYLQKRILFCFILISAISKVFSAEKPCGDWEPYKDDKCLKIFEEPGLADYQDAENYCQVEQEAHLISIGLEENQKFIENFLKTNQIADNVWIGLKYTNGTYEWSDGTESHYSNWDEGSPKNLTDHCVQLGTDERAFGKWSDVLCTKKDLVICEKLQLWSQNFLQTTVMDLLYNLNVSQLEIAELQAKVKNLENSLSEVTENPVPIGFIYVQLPNQQAPLEIWPWMVWVDVSSEYAGLFFRVNGGNSSDFGTVQSEDSPRLIKLGWGEIYKNNLDHDLKDIRRAVDVIPNGEWSDNLEMGSYSGHWLYLQNLNVIVSKAEVRPRNTAMKIWKRTD